MSVLPDLIHLGDTCSGWVSTTFGTPHDPNDEPVPHVTHAPDIGLRWPDPIVPEPEFLTLAQFLFEAIAEATDGCPVEPYGVCTRSHPSWLRRLGVI